MECIVVMARVFLNRLCGGLCRIGSTVCEQCFTVFINAAGSRLLWSGLSQMRQEKESQRPHGILLGERARVGTLCDCLVFWTDLGNFG